MPGIGEVCEVRGQAVRGHRALGEVVGADRDEVDDLEDPVGQQRGGGCLDHDPGGESAGTNLGRDVGCLVDGRERGGCRSDTPVDTLVRLTIATMEGLQQQWLATSAGFDMAEEFRRYVESQKRTWKA
ncbi:hypothetical protein Lesp01_35590 [Lentzea sp. NBRC 102530]|nr:hypothetical protein Lesp01_35590 [Lentzea sp. NBRC 102530]